MVRVIGVMDDQLYSGDSVRIRFGFTRRNEGDDIAHEAVGRGHHTVGVAIEEGEPGNAQLHARRCSSRRNSPIR